MPLSCQYIAVFLSLSHLIKVKTGSRSTSYLSVGFIRLNGWPTGCFQDLILTLTSITSARIEKTGIQSEKGWLVTLGTVLIVSSTPHASFT